MNKTLPFLPPMSDSPPLLLRAFTYLSDTSSYCYYNMGHYSSNRLSLRCLMGVYCVFRPQRLILKTILKLIEWRWITAVASFVLERKSLKTSLVDLYASCWMLVCQLDDFQRSLINGIITGLFQGITEDRLPLNESDGMRTNLKTKFITLKKKHYSVYQILGYQAVYEWIHVL